MILRPETIWIFSTADPRGNEANSDIHQYHPLSAPGVKREKSDLYGDGRGFQDPGEDAEDDPEEPVNVPKAKRNNSVDRNSYAMKIIEGLNVVEENKDYDVVMSESGRGKPTVIYKGNRYHYADKDKKEISVRSKRSNKFLIFSNARAGRCYMFPC